MQKSGTTLAHAARNGVMGASSSLKQHNSNVRTSGSSVYGTTAGMRAQSRGKPGSRHLYERQTSGVSSGSASITGQQARGTYGAAGSQSYARLRAEEESKVARSRASGATGS